MRYILLALLSTFFVMEAKAQKAEVKIQRIGVAYDKTVHLVFPDKILYVDLGSETIMASIIEEKPNILRIKAAEKGFKEETNLSVVLESEDIQCFDIYWCDSLKRSVYYFGKKESSEETEVTVSAAERIYHENKTRITSIGSTHHGVSMTLKSLYCDKNFIYIHLEISNRSFIPFVTEAITIGTDRIRNIRRGQPSGSELSVEETFGEPDLKGNFRMVIGINSFTFRDDEMMRVQIYEKGGSRHVGFELDNRTFKRVLEQL